MKSVKVSKDHLLAKLKDNRNAHAKEYDDALAGYRKAAVSRLTEMLELAKDGKKIQTHISLVEPVSKLSEYDAAIAMLEMSVDETIELQAHEFDQYVLDNWVWRDHAKIANSSYLVGGDAKRGLLG